jgi:aspartate/methionine/tyrosine aminotransferase
LQEKLFVHVIKLLQQKGLVLKKGTIVDSTFIEVPCKEKQVIVAPGSSFYISPAAGFEQHLRISFASTDQLEKGFSITGGMYKICSKP